MTKPLRLTVKMKMALERLYQADGYSDFVSLKTADALQDRGLVRLPRSLSQRTQGGQFPEYKVTLTATGQKVCETYFNTVRRYSNT